LSRPIIDRLEGESHPGDRIIVHKKRQTTFGLAQRRFDPSEHRQHDRNGLCGGLPGKPRCKRHARFALMKNEHRPRALTNDEVTLPVAAFGFGVDLLGPFVDGDAILDGISRGSRSLKERLKIPNACNLCHTDKTTAWQPPRSTVGATAGRCLAVVRLLREIPNRGAL
jgi:hypothetical protein